MVVMIFIWKSSFSKLKGDLGRPLEISSADVRCFRLKSVQFMSSGKSDALGLILFDS